MVKIASKLAIHLMQTSNSLSVTWKLLTGADVAEPVMEPLLYSLRCVGITVFDILKSGCCYSVGIYN